MTVTDFHTPPSTAPPSGPTVAQTARAVLLDSLTEMVTDVVGPCAMATLTVVEHAVPDTVATSHPEAVDLDEAQYDEDSGPCFTAQRTRATVALDRIVAGPGRYEGFRRVAAEVGVVAVVSAPIEVRGRTTGSLNCYATDGEFGDDDIDAVVAAARHAGHLLAAARMFATVGEPDHTDTEDPAVAAATWILVGRHDVGPGTAREMLRRCAQARDVGIAEVAHEVVTLRRLA